MAVRFVIPAYLRTFTSGRSEVELELARDLKDVGAALEALWAAHPGVRDRVLTETGDVRPHVNVFVDGESAGLADAALSYEWAHQLVTLLAARSHQKSTAEQPLLSASLPTGERVQAVLPPACTPGRVVLAIRRPSSRTWSLDELAERGVFSGCGRSDEQRACDRMHAAYEARDWHAFLRLAVNAKQTILVSGATGMTVSLTTSLKGATPYGVPVDLHGRFTGREGRKSYTSGEVVVDGRVTAEATAIFVSERR